MRVMFTCAGVIVGVALSFAASSQSVWIVLTILAMCFWFLFALFVASNRNVYDKEKMQSYYVEKLMNELAEKQKELDNANQYSVNADRLSQVDMQVLLAERAMLDDAVNVIKELLAAKSPEAGEVDRKLSSFDAEQVLKRYEERRS